MQSGSTIRSKSAKVSTLNSKMHSQDAGGNMYLDMVTSEEGQPKKNKTNTEQNRTENKNNKK